MPEVSHGCGVDVELGDSRSITPTPEVSHGCGGDVELGDSPATTPTPEVSHGCGGDVEPANSPVTTPKPEVKHGLWNFDFQELESATNGFSKEKLLGEGGFGDVFKGVLADGSTVAVKKLRPGSKQGDTEFQAEIASIGRIHHRNLVPLIGFCVDSQNKLLVYPFIQNQSLHSHLHGNKSPTINWNNRMKIAIGTAKGLTYLHEECSPRIIHRDIKAANVLLDLDFKPMVGDFGLAKLFPDNATHVSTAGVKGTFGYLTPEYCSRGELKHKIDVYAFGVLLLELITGKRPLNEECYDGKNMAAWAMPLLDRALNKEKYDTIVDHKLKKDYDPVEMKRMMLCARACISINPVERPEMSEAVDTLKGKNSAKSFKSK